MKVIAVMNQKGGIAKTITASSISYILGEIHKKKVLVIDGDQQGNISKLYNRYEPEGIGMSELLEHHKVAGGEYTTNNLIKTTPYERVDIIPSNGYLMRTNMHLLLNQNENQINRFESAIKELQGIYDYIICDCGLILDMTVTNILMASDLVILPVKVGGFEIDAIENMIEQIDDLRQLNPRLDYKVLMTMKQRNKSTIHVEEWIKSNYKAYKCSIRRSIVVENSTTAYVPLPKFSPNSIASKDYKEVVLEFIEDMEVLHGSRI